MGLFLAMSGIAGASRSAVEEALKNYAQSKGGDFGPDTENEEFPDVMVVGEAGDNRITVLYPGEFMTWDKASAHLSRSLSVPVFSFHIHDEDLWMYTLSVEGEDVDHFTPIPDYWFDDLPDEERELWAGNAAVVARYWPGVEAKAIENYLVPWDLDEEEPGKAYDDDEFEYHDCWQLVDFMRKLGLLYPLSEQGQALGTTHRFEVPDEPDDD
jgi:hypothetical protein